MIRFDHRTLSFTDWQPSSLCSFEPVTFASTAAYLGAADAAAAVGGLAAVTETSALAAAASSVASAFATVAPYVSIGGAILGAAGAAQAGRAQQDMSGYQAAIMQQQAERERKQAEADATELRSRNQRLMARQRTLYSASGVTREGTPLLVEEDTAAEAELEALKVLSGGQVRATRLEQQAGLERFSGRLAKQQGYARGGALLLSGVGGAFS